MDRYDDTRNNELYKDTTPHKVIKTDERKKKAFYVFRTMVSVARLSGFYVRDNLIIEDGDGGKYNSKDYLTPKRDV